MSFNQRITITAGGAWAVYDLVETGAVEVPAPSPTWVLPVGMEPDYPPAAWYMALGHGPSHLYPSGFHTGCDFNLNRYEHGDVERRLGLSVRACADGIVHWVGVWSGNGCVVIQVEHAGAPLWVRYGHVTPVVLPGEVVHAGQKLGGFDNWSPTAPNRGDHLHNDMRTHPLTNEWCTPPLSDWLNPLEVYKAHVDPDLVAAMVRRGD
jgi:murein DD-endopeptidase MepM/ murein hydrolase activator NlpD